MKDVTEANINDASPEFRIIFIPAHSSDHLKIPPTFRKKLQGVFPSEYILESRGKTWRVTVNEVHDDLLYLENGWPEFVKDSALAFGDFLVFSYISSSKFRVGLWDRNGCRKIIPDSEVGQTTNFCNTFQVTMRPTYSSYVNIPRPMGKLMNNHTMCTLKIANDSWAVKFTGHESGRPRFGGGLSQFYKDNKVKIGDILSFQLISEHNNTFTVDISRR